MEQQNTEMLLLIIKYSARCLESLFIIILCLSSTEGEKKCRRYYFHTMFTDWAHPKCFLLYSAGFSCKELQIIGELRFRGYINKMNINDNKNLAVLLRSQNMCETCCILYVNVTHDLVDSGVYSYMSPTRTSMWLKPVTHNVKNNKCKILQHLFPETMIIHRTYEFSETPKYNLNYLHGNISMDLSKKLYYLIILTERLNFKI